MKATYNISALLLGLIAWMDCKQDAFVGAMDPDTGGSGGSTLLTGGAGGAGGAGAVGTGQVVEVVEVVEVAAGDYHTCALMADSSVRCWGFNYGGQIGNGTSGDTVLTPTKVIRLSGVVHIDADYTDSCAQLSDGSLRCWGSNNYGQLGDGTLTERNTPVSVLDGKPVQQISLAQYHSCVLLPDGTVTWYGIVTEAGATTIGNPTPSLVPGLVKVKQISAGVLENCALREDGTVSCWWPLSDVADTSWAAEPVAGLSQVVKVAVATATACALLEDGTVMCWGRNSYGSVGDGTTVDRQSPTPLAGLSGVADLAPGKEHFCALLVGGNVVCWGLNDHGQLGDGSTTNRSAPVVVAGLTGVKQVSAGVTHTCALLETGDVMCWGDELAYVSNNSPFANRLTPAPIVF